MKSNRPLAILLVAFLALAVFYSVIIPLFEGPDEDDHFRYAKFLADRRALPVQEFVTGGGEAGHQGWQPPLYYGLAALLISPLDTSDYAEHLWRNPSATFVGDPSCCGRNIYFHTVSEGWPFSRTTLAVHLARLLSVLFGGVTVWATYMLAKTILEEARVSTPDALLPLAAASLVAFNPSFLFASALVSNDALLAALSSLILLLWVQLLCRRVSTDFRSVGILTLLLALAVLTKTTALGLIPFSMLVVAIAAWRDGSRIFAVAGNALLLAFVAVLTGAWFARNLTLYGDPLAYRLMTTSAIFPRSGPLTPAELFQISLPWFWQTLWGGPTPGDMAPGILVLLGVLTLLAAIGMILFVARNFKSTLLLPVLILAGWLGFILSAQIQFIRTTVGADQGRYLFPALPAFALFFVLGWIELSRLVPPKFSPRPARFLPLALIVAMFLFAVGVPFAYTLPAYARPALPSAAELARISKPLAVTFNDQVQLMGYDLDRRSFKPGDTLQATLYWRSLAPAPQSYRVFVHLVGQDDQSAGGVDVIPARGAFPTVYWKPGDVVRDVVQIPIALNAKPGKYAMEVGLYPAEKIGDRLPISETGEDRVVLDSIKVGARQPVTFLPQTPLDVDFGGKANLFGYDSALSPDRLMLTLFWKCTGKFDRDYTVFIHVLDDNGNVVGQVDRQPQGGNYPTTIWDVGEQIRDDYIVPLNASLSNYRVELGFYRQDTFERLAVGTGAGGDDHLEFNVAGAVR